MTDGTQEVARSEKPIRLLGEEVRAILDGRKTQTRRVMKPQPAPLTDRVEWNTAAEAFRQWRPSLLSDSGGVRNGPDMMCPYGQPGDRLWVREAFTRADDMLGQQTVYYRADCEDIPGGFKPSTYMPRWASRLTLEITDVRVQHIRDISVNDALAEGACVSSDPDEPDDFMNLWNRINGPRGYGWNANPWVWAITFRRVESAHV